MVELTHAVGWKELHALLWTAYVRNFLLLVQIGLLLLILLALLRLSTQLDSATIIPPTNEERTAQI